MSNLLQSSVSKSLSVFSGRLQGGAASQIFSHSSLPNSADLAYIKIVVRLLRNAGLSDRSQSDLLNKIATSLGYKHFSSLTQAVPSVLQSIEARAASLPDIFLWAVGLLTPSLMDQKRSGDANNLESDLVSIFSESINAPVFHFNFKKDSRFSINEILIFPTGVLLDRWEAQERVHDVSDLSLLAIDYEVKQDCEQFRKQDLSSFLWWAKTRAVLSGFRSRAASEGKRGDEDSKSDLWRGMEVGMLAAVVNAIRYNNGIGNNGIDDNALLGQLELSRLIQLANEFKDRASVPENMVSMPLQMYLRHLPGLDWARHVEQGASLLEETVRQHKFRIDEMVKRLRAKQKQGHQIVSDLFSNPPSYCVLESAHLAGICNSAAMALAFPEYGKSATLCTGVFSSKGGRVPEYFSSNGEGDYHKGNAVRHASADVPKDELLLWELGLNATHMFGRLNRVNSAQLLTATPKRMYGAVDKEGNFLFSTVREKRHHVIISSSERKYGGLSQGKLLMEPSFATFDMWEKPEGMAKEHHGWIIQNPDGTFWIETLSPTEEEAGSWWGSPEKALRSQALGMRLMCVRVFVDKGE